MRRISILVLLALTGRCLGQTNAPGAQAAVAAPAPKIAFSETSFDFGKVESGELVKHVYTFTNVGNATLEVSEVRPGCGCTTAGEWDKSVEPGKTGRIPVQFNSAAYGGHVSKNITVTCNDPAQKTPILFLNGTVWKPIEISPPVASFMLPPENQTRQTQVLKIVNNLEEPLTLWPSTNRNAAFELEFKTNTVGKEFELKVTVVPPIGEGSISARYDFPTSSRKVSILNVMVFAYGKPRITLSPAQLSLPPGPLQAASQQIVVVENNTTNTLALSEPVLQIMAGPSPAAEKIEGVDIQVKEPAPGHLFNVTLNFPAGFKIEGGKRVELHLKSSLPGASVLTLPIYQPLRPPTIAVPPAAPPAKQGS
ncbi:MAG: hypothetical protein C5B50_26455 [Verrucomicrobia bacterium]|nr:MAG: hypothetical protein C5B50_26455 [Verrucomicrobiota bacterium]